ncbi:helix-turn-helix transcriptional regulator [Solirubrobacter sp. CPCC 204708]|uniref:Metalloregulator ArsR/SmtB family transcription factor n=1 Tax=Solirubrobacter deserti TaxID=2282478 RepID=A0ABT4RLR3_9ACTN|nr:metalloregulator ArsR/SmtB family transcription factor [Solirubrobacter deserti]MBE2316736.1 helix-turn-helix transcriptional regulator [Solirubrobacter deserti]MDA0139492.1 metalloregulator ArsR/SmtB family transcription factor [Solirubrobacter deserti]
MADPRVAVLKALAHPLRLRVVDRLGHVGPAPVSALAVELDASLPDVSAALRVLREAGVVDVSRSGRSAVYALAEVVGPVLPWLDRVVGARAAAPVASHPSRTCYGHLAGPLGVELYRRLVADGVLAAGADGTVSVVRGDVLARLGVGAVERGRRQLAFECLDATEGVPHLAGALGDALASTFFARGWVERVGSGREVALTVDGGLERLLGADDP